MKWNWQQDHWPNFSYHSEKIQKYEREFLHRAGVMYGSFKHVQSEDRDQLSVQLFCFLKLY